MAFKPASFGSTFKPAPEGTHTAVLTQIIDLGTQEGYQGKRTPKLRITWELPDLEKVDINGTLKSPIIMSTYTISDHEKSLLRPVVEGMIGRGLKDEDLGENYGKTLENLLGRGCMLAVKHNESNGRTFANVTSVVALPKGHLDPKPDGALLFYAVEDGENEVFQGFGQRTQDKIRGCDEWAGEMATAFQD